MNKILSALVLALCTSSAMASGNHDDAHSAKNQSEVDRNIRIEAGDMWFDPDSLDIAPGETIKFDVENVGRVEHEFVIGDANAQEKHRNMMQEMGSEGHGDDHAEHHMAEGDHGGGMPSITIKPGETKQLVWTAPEDVSSLEYACNIPGHYESGMSGKIDIQ